MRSRNTKNQKSLYSFARPFPKHHLHVSIIFCTFIFAPPFSKHFWPPRSFLTKPKKKCQPLPKESSANHSCNEWNENCSTSKARCSSWVAVREWDVGWDLQGVSGAKPPPQIRVGLFQHFFRQVWRCGFLPDVHVVHAGTFATLIFTISQRLFTNRPNGPNGPPLAATENQQANYQGIPCILWRCRGIAN